MTFRDVLANSLSQRESSAVCVPQEQKLIFNFDRVRIILVEKSTQPLDMAFLPHGTLELVKRSLGLMVA